LRREYNLKGNYIVAVIFNNGNCFYNKFYCNILYIEKFFLIFVCVIFIDFLLFMVYYIKELFLLCLFTNEKTF